MNKEITRICLTWGPCSWKTTVLNTLIDKFSEMGYKVLVCPEAATSLSQSGITYDSWLSWWEFQWFVLDKQLQEEEILDKAAEKLPNEKILILYDRGVCDGKAYIDEQTYNKLLKERNLAPNDVRDKYNAVIHLVTAALWATKYYQRNDPNSESTGNNAARHESPQEAIIADEKTKKAWIWHPHLRVISNDTTFSWKISNVIKEICWVLWEPLPKEIEQKYLIKKPTIEDLKNLWIISKAKIVQTYLKSKNWNERRIRQRWNETDWFSYYYTEKKPIFDWERYEFEKKITKEEYLRLMTEADYSLHHITKDRYCFLYDNRYFELDIYPFSDEYAILEIELNSLDEKVNLPNLEIIKNVTWNSEYSNNNLAKTLTLQD